MKRRDDNYICLRVTPEERELYDEKRARTIFSVKTFLLKCLRGEELREKAPEEAFDARHQLIKISLNLTNLSSSRKNPPIEQRILFDKRYDALSALMNDITDLIYNAKIWVDDN